MNLTTSLGTDRPISTGPAEGGEMRPPPFIERFDLVEVCRMLWRRKWAIVLTGLGIMLFGAIVILSLTPRYTATSYVELSPRRAQVVDFETVLSGLPADSATIETEIEILKSRTLASKTVAKLELEQHPEFNSALRAPSLFTAMSMPRAPTPQSRVEPNASTAGNQTDETADRTEDPGQGTDDAASGMFGPMWQRLAVYVQGGDPSELDDPDISREQLEQRVAKERSSVVDKFLSRLDIRPRGRSRVIAVSFESKSPFIAAAAANALSEFYIVAQLEAKFEAAKRANAWLNERITQLRKEVAAAEQAVEEFRGHSGLIRGGTDATLAGEQVSELNTQHVMERTRLAEAEARLRQAEKLLGSPQAIETAGEVLNSQTIRDLRREETTVEQRVAELSTEYGERHPRMVNARAELKDIKGKINEEIQKIIQSLRNEVAVARARAGALNVALNRMKSEIASLNESEVRLRALEREAAASRTLLEQLLERSKETASQTDFQQPDATIITEAPVPEMPSYPKKGLMFAVVFVLAAISGIGVAFAIERMDYGFRSMDQLERQLGLSTLGLIPSIGGIRSIGKNPADYALDKPLSAYSEAIRNIYTNLLLTDVGREFKTVLISSALPNEGKTSIAVSLARLLANQDLKVIVLDCDLRKPSLHRLFGLPAEPGIAECLAGTADLESVTVEDDKSDIHFIRAGKTPSSPATLMDSVSMQRLLKALSREYDLILLDSAPVLAVSDTLFLGRLVDKAIFIVRWGRTRRESVELALKRMSEAHCDVSGVLLSMVDVKGHAKYGYSDSGAYHGELRRYYTG